MFTLVYTTKSHRLTRLSSICVMHYFLISLNTVLPGASLIHSNTHTHVHSCMKKGIPAYIIHLYTARHVALTLTRSLLVRTSRSRCSAINFPPRQESRERGETRNIVGARAPAHQRINGALLSLSLSRARTCIDIYIRAHRAIYFLSAAAAI